MLNGVDVILYYLTELFGLVSLHTMRAGLLFVFFKLISNSASEPLDINLHLHLPPSDKGMNEFQVNILEVILKWLKVTGGLI